MRVCSLTIYASRIFCVDLITSHQGSHKFAFTDAQIINDSFGSCQTCSIILLSNPSSLLPGTRSKALKEKHELHWKRGQNGNQGQEALKCQQIELDLFCLSSFREKLSTRLCPCTAQCCLGDRSSQSSLSHLAPLDRLHDPKKTRLKLAHRYAIFLCALVVEI